MRKSIIKRKKQIKRPISKLIARFLKMTDRVRARRNKQIIINNRNEDPELFI